MLNDIALTCYYLAPWFLPVLAFVFIGTAILDNF